jgi:hypothetical protein
MSGAKPYDQCRRERGAVVFEADLPAFASFGRRYDELYNAYYHFRYSRADVEAARAFARAVEDAAERALSREGDWKEIEPDLERRFGETYRRLRSSLLSFTDQFARTSAEGLAHGLKLLVVQAKSDLATKINACDDPGAADPPVERQAATPPRADLTTSDRARGEPEPSRETVPDDQGGLEQALSSMARLVGAPHDQASVDSQLQNLIKTLGVSPDALHAMAQQMSPADADQLRRRVEGALAGLSRFREQFRGQAGSEPSRENLVKGRGPSSELLRMIEQQKAVIERVKAQNPAVARQMERQLREMEQFAVDPSAAAAEMTASVAEHEADSEPEDEKPSLPPGRFRVECGAKGPSDHQKRLFDWLSEHQSELAPQVEQALRAMHAERASGINSEDPQERVLFPPDAAKSDVPLSCFRIERILVADSGDRIGVTFDSMLEDEHGCALLIEGGKVADFGYEDVLEPLYYGDDGFEHDDDEEDDDE